MNVCFILIELKIINFINHIIKCMFLAFVNYMTYYQALKFRNKHLYILAPLIIGPMWYI